MDNGIYVSMKTSEWMRSVHISFAFVFGIILSNVVGKAWPILPGRTPCDPCYFNSV